MTALGAPQTKTGPRRSTLDRRTAMRLAATEYDRCAAQLSELSPEDWTRPTACPEWDVHALACHILGMAEMAASPLEQARQMRAAKKRRGLFIDALTALQVAKHIDRAPAEIVERIGDVGPRAAKGRRRTPAPLRAIRLADQPIEDTGSRTETWTLGYLVDTILTRDPWMHRSDIAEATGHPMTLSAGHDGVLIADVAAEWAGRHGQPCGLTLSGPAGGTWTWGTGGPQIALDAVDFCRVVSGRGRRDGLLATPVPF